MNRQRIRKMTLIIALMLFPITIWYFSPYLIIMGAMEGIVNGSFIVFCSMLLISLFFGRVFCSFLCPMGGLQECIVSVNDNVPKQGWRIYIKYVVWVIWIVAILICFLNQDARIKLDFFYQTDHGISVSNIYCYIIYYGIVLLVLIPGVLFGKRSFCHYFCWMVPFMVIGIQIRKILHIPGLHIKVKKDACISCKACNKKCPMGLDVYKMVQTGGSNSRECIHCGECVDSCPKKALRYSMEREI